MTNKTSCPGKPELLKGQPIGMYHCEYCGAMVLAGLPHPTDEQVKEAGDKAIKYLISIGHERIAYLGGLPIASSNIDRLKGYKKGLEDSNIEIDESLIFQKDFSQTTGYYYVKLIYDNLSQKPTAIFSANNMITIGALMALNELSIKIPQDLSFVMFDDMQDTMNLWKVPITTVRVPREKLAEEAFNVLYKKLTKNQSDYKRHIIIQPDLILRKSCKSI
jgi:DNA-binding LacI/PurR family transcriptional regulator